jgi:Tol biopolymer transport system component
MTPFSGRVSHHPRAAAAALALLVCAVVSGLVAGGAGATFPGRNGEIVVVRSKPHTQRQIYVGNRAGHFRLLSKGFGFAAGPDVSPDGQRVVFRGLRSGGANQQIFSIRVNGTGLRQLTHHPTDSLGPAYGANGRFVLYDSYDNNSHGDTTNLWKLNLRTGKTRPLNVGGRSPAVSPNGRIFVTVVQGGGTQYSELWSARVDGSHPRRITHERYFAEQPDFSPNGRWIVYRTLRPCDGRGAQNAIVVTNPTGTKTRVVAQDCHKKLSAPVFSPNGHTIAFVREGVIRSVSFPKPGKIGHLLRHRPQHVNDSNVAWQAR